MKRLLKTRTTDELRAKIERSAFKSGRSLAQEVEHRVELSFYEDDRTRMYVNIRGVQDTIERRVSEMRDEMVSINDRFARLERILAAYVTDAGPPPQLRDSNGADSHG